MDRYLPLFGFSFGFVCGKNREEHRRRRVFLNLFAEKNSRMEQTKNPMQRVNSQKIVIIILMFQKQWETNSLLLSNDAQKKEPQSIFKKQKKISCQHNDSERNKLQEYNRDNEREIIYK
jgi:hypothetical protein